MNNDEDDNIISFQKKIKAAVSQNPSSEPAINLPPMVKKMSGVIVFSFILAKILPFLFGAVWVDDALLSLSFIPARYTGEMAFDLSAVFSPLTYMLLHGGWMHLGMNLVSLMAFGAGLEKFMGGKKMLILFIAGGIVGVFLHALLATYTMAPVIGASGGISGLFGAVLVYMRDSGMLGGAKKLMPFVALWVVVSLIFGLFGMPGSGATIAWATHIGGFIAGMALYYPVLRMRD